MDNVQRIRRKQFYLKNGFHESGIQVTWQGEKYEMVVANGDLTEEELDLFWKHVFQRG